MSKNPLLPPVDEYSEPFWQGARRNELRLQRCLDTGRLIYQLSGRADAGVGTDSAYGGGRPFPHLEHGVLSGDHPLVGRQLLQPEVDGKPLDELLGAGFALLVVDPHVVGEDVRDAFGAVGGRIVELAEPVAELVLLPVGGAIVVRPDRYVAAVAANAGELSAAVNELRQWFG